MSKALRAYRRPIQIRSDDPVCSVTTLEGTIVGVLFDKKGSEIREVIGKRVQAINSRIGECEGVISSVRTFLQEKEDQIRLLDDLRIAREDEKNAVTAPMRREIDEICHRMRMKVFEFNSQTEKQIAEKASTFADKFDDYKDKFRAVDKFLDEVFLEEQIASLSARSMASGWTGIQGHQGNCGWQGYQGSVGDSGRRNAELSDEENKALARLNTLRSVVRTYVDRINKIAVMIEQLNEEKRRLLLISDNIDLNRSYKLDLNKLSAFGFEDVIILPEASAQK